MCSDIFDYVGNIELIGLLILKGYDDIPKEITDPDAKKVMCIELVCSHILLSAIRYSLLVK